MAIKKLIFRADGNSETGLGHLYRVFALIDMFKDKYHCELLISKNSNLNSLPVKYQCHVIPTNSLQEEVDWMVQHYSPTEYKIIADGYQFTTNYQKALKDAGYFLVYIDDLVLQHQYADRVVNHSNAIQEKDYICESYTKFGLGTSYAILRSKFLEAAKRIRVLQKPDIAFVCFGGADPLNLTYKATQALLKIEQFKKIKVVVGGAYVHSDIYELQKREPRLGVYKNLNEAELIKVMESCSFAIAPASTILYELCTVKMPILSGYYVENQKNIYKGTRDAGIIFDGGDFENYSVTDFETKLKEVLAETDFQKYSDAQAKLFDSNIKQRFVDLIAEITYRKAASEDMLLLFDWTNDKITRSNSFFPEPIPLKTHQNWFEKKIKDDKCLIFIAESDQIPAGMLRYEIGEDKAVVGVSIASEFRGKGLSNYFLKDTARLYFEKNDQPIVAYIKKENIASIRSFEKAGYKKIKEEIIQGFDSFVYKLEKHDV